MAFPNKKPGGGTAVMVAIGKPKDGPPPLNRLDKSSDDTASTAPSAHDEPDADQMGGPSDNDADNRIEENIGIIQQHSPEALHPIADLIEQMANICRKAGGGGGKPGMPAQDNESGGY